MGVSYHSLFVKTGRSGSTGVVVRVWPKVRRTILLLLCVAAIAASAKAQLPEAPSASVIAPLKRYSLNIGMDNKYSLTTSLYDLTPRVGMSVRLGERETMGFSYSRSTVMNNQHVQSNSVVMWLNFRVMSWGKIPMDR